MISDELLSYLWCPLCKGVLKIKDKLLICNRCRSSFRVIGDNTIDFLKSANSKRWQNDKEISFKSWDSIYKKWLVSNGWREKWEEYKCLYLDDTVSQLFACKLRDKKVFLEIGCGPCFLGCELAKHFEIVIGVDFSREALKIAQRVFENRKISNFLLLCSDLTQMPIVSDRIDLIYGGGVIEHFRNPQTVIEELYRVLRADGVAFNTVPYLNLASLTYRQYWGNIPNFPLMKQIAEFIHLKLLRARHMRFGYEYSFTKTYLRRLHRKVGFSEVKIDRFNVALKVELLPRFCRYLVSYLSNRLPLFWPMIKVVAKK